MARNQIANKIAQRSIEKPRRITVADMANLRPDKTGLPMVIWIFPQTGKEKHKTPRIKVQTHHGSKAQSGSWVTVTVEAEPKIIGSGLSGDDIEIVKQFIMQNKTGLLKVWNDKIDPVDFANTLKKLD